MGVKAEPCHSWADAHQSAMVPFHLGTRHIDQWVHATCCSPVNRKYYVSKWRLIPAFSLAHHTVQRETQIESFIAWIIAQLKGVKSMNRVWIGLMLALGLELVQWLLWVKFGNVYGWKSCVIHASESIEWAHVCQIWLTYSAWQIHNFVLVFSGLC